jgi:tRNA threonylcarbamoyladenosine biosynthesis protein TsaE
MRVVSKSLTDTAGAAKVLLSQLEPGENQATVLGLVGDLGSGKTTFTQALARELGVEENVTSPTFVIEKFYPLKHKKWQRLVHIDTYRLNKPEELAHLRFQELLDDSQTLIVIEWAERVEVLLPADYHRINFKFIDEETREISFT